jgi:hypothetical protein
VVAGGLIQQDEQGFAVVQAGSASATDHALAVYRFALSVLQIVGASDPGELRRMPESD